MPLCIRHHILSKEINLFCKLRPLTNHYVVFYICRIYLIFIFSDQILSICQCTYGLSHILDLCHRHNLYQCISQYVFRNASNSTIAISTSFISTSFILKSFFITFLRVNIAASCIACRCDATPSLKSVIGQRRRVARSNTTQSVAGSTRHNRNFGERPSSFKGYEPKQRLRFQG